MRFQHPLLNRECKWADVDSHIPYTGPVDVKVKLPVALSVHVDPAGRFCPLYQRDHYRTNTTGWRKEERFFSNEIVHW
jgi:hypothetical protein